MSIFVYSVLIFNNKPVGVRFKNGDKFQDVELAKLKNVTVEDLKGYKTQNLKMYEKLLATEEEIQKGIIVKDMSNNSYFCEFANIFLKRNTKEIIKATVWNSNY